jgi:hypothetical protein
MKTDKNMGNVRTLVRKGFHLVIRMIAEELNTGKETARNFNKKFEHDKTTHLHTNGFQFASF